MDLINLYNETQENMFNGTLLAANFSDLPPALATRCVYVKQPSFEASLEVLGQETGFGLYFSGAVAFLFVLIVAIDTMRHIVNNVPSQFKANSLMLIIIYPVMSLVSYLAIIVPRFQTIAEATIMFAWMVGLYQLFCLFVGYAGGETLITKTVEVETLDMKVAPCCCWPCCCLPTPTLNKKSLRIPRIAILQLSLIQFLVYMVLLAFWEEDEYMFQKYFIYLQIVAIPSIFFAVWGMTQVLRLLAPLLRDHFMYPKYICLQFLLVFSKFQGSIARITIWLMLNPCQVDLQPSVLSYLICNGLFLLELMVLVVLARIFYKRPLPDASLAQSTLAANRIQHVINNNKQVKEGIDNVIFA